MKIAETRLIPYGFIKQEHSYVYVCPILDRQFSVCIQIIHQQIKSQIVDNETQEPYIVWKTHPEGRFVQSVRSAYDQVMHNFFQHCCIAETYRFAQTNRMDAQMPTPATFPFRKYPSYGAYKRHGKWYALIQCIDKEKLGIGQGPIEIINVKANASQCLHRLGIYPAWHMNKQHWISIGLDDTLTDEEILSYIQDSFDRTV